LKLVFINRGHNPRDFSLIAFGGGGTLHAAWLARELGMTKVIVPPNASVFSAWGMLMLDLRRDYIQTDLVPLTGDYAGVIAERFSALEWEARTEYRRDGFGQDRIVCQCFIDARYKGQEHTVKVPLHSLDAD